MKISITLPPEADEVLAQTIAQSIQTMLPKLTGDDWKRLAKASNDPSKLSYLRSFVKL